MFLSNRDIQWAIGCGKLIVEPRPEELGGGYDETSIDLHLGSVTVARVWNIAGYRRASAGHSARRRAELEMGSFDWNSLANQYLIPVPDEDPENEDQLVFRRDSAIVVRPFGFLLWATKERVGTPRVDPLDKESQRHPELISFVNAKSTKARVGLLVHFTAPTIHAGWAGNITLEISNLGEFDFVFREGDALAQLTVATISSAPNPNLRTNSQQTQGQVDPTGAPPPAPVKPARKRKKPE